jgi:SAM-dependent methyltransferase
VTAPSLLETYLRQAADPAAGEHWAGPPELVDRLAGRLATRCSDRVVDIGCGVGGPARRLAATIGCPVVAVDVLPAVLREARARSRGRAAPTFVAGTACSLPFRAAAFDQAWCLGVVAHVDGLDDLAAEVARVLRPGGRLCVTEALWDGKRPARFVGTAPFPWNALTADQLAGHLARGGLVDVTVEPWPALDVAPVTAVRHAALRADLCDGRLQPRLLTARRPDG